MDHCDLEIMGDFKFRVGVGVDMDVGLIKRFRLN